jgi:hypothetical protein
MKQVQSKQDFLQLLAGLIVLQPIPVRYTALLQYPEVPGEDDALLPQGQIDDRDGVPIPFISRVKSQHTSRTGQVSTIDNNVKKAVVINPH